MKRALIAMLVAAGLRAQVPLVDPEQITKTAELFEQLEGEPLMSCGFGKPNGWLSYHFREVRSFQYEISGQSMAAKSNRLFAAIRARGEGGEWQYFARQFRFSPLPDDRRHVELNGSMALVFGKGKYEAELALVNQQGAVCRNAWQFSSTGAPQLEEVMAPEAPSTVKTVFESLELAKLKARREGELLIVVNIGRFGRVRAKVSAYEQWVLTTALAGVLEQLPFQRTRVVAVSLDQQATVFESEQLTQEEFDGLQRSIDDLQVGTIDIKKLNRLGGHMQALEEALLGKMDRHPKAVVVLSLPSSFDDKPTPRLEELMRGFEGKAFYLKLLSPGDAYVRRNDGFERPLRNYAVSDVYQRLVRAAGGKVLDVYTPKDYAKALNRLGRELEPRTSER